MSAVDASMIERFTQKAELVSAFVSHVNTQKEAFEYLVDLCEKKEACQLLASGCEERLSEAAGELCEAKQEKVVAAVGMPTKQFNVLKGMCDEKGFKIITEGLRDYLAGIDIGVTVADYAIADTGTIVQDSSSEELRLSTMISEVHVVIVPKSKIRATAYDLEEEIKGMMKDAPNYLAFITGASRTADIERVLAMGVHGPLEEHILIWEDK